MRERAAAAAAMSSSRAGARAERLPEATLRSQLFGSSLGGPPSSSSSRDGPSSSSMQQALEEDNNRLTDDLQAKVTALRFATQSIHDEVSEHNRMLSGMARFPRPRPRPRPRRPAPLTLPQYNASRALILTALGA